MPAPKSATFDLNEPYKVLNTNLNDSNPILEIKEISYDKGKL